MSGLHRRNPKSELLGSSGMLADRITHQFQQMAFDMIGGQTVDRSYRAGDQAQPRKEHPGQGDHPLTAVSGRQMHQLLENGMPEVASRRGMPEKGPDLKERDSTGG